MNMKDHMLTALREQYERWEALVASLSEEQINQQWQPTNWKIKDIIAHLMAWEQRSIARMEAAQFDRKPEYPRWSPEQDLESEENTDQINAWIYEFHRDLPWEQTRQQWSQGLWHLLSIAETISERDLLDSSRYAWLEGYPLAQVLLGSYDHHQEHYEKLEAWLQERGKLDFPA